ncbi:MAG: hypothetical protein OXG99_08495 [Alphaproteobacteria bacterium]|nr:hypothetical protein [Alphaproteobacteria bacterium]
MAESFPMLPRGYAAQRFYAGFEVTPVERHQRVGAAVDRGFKDHLVGRIVKQRTPPEIDGYMFRDCA